MKAILYIHGKDGTFREAEQYKKNCAGFDIIGVDYNEYLPWIVQEQIKKVYDELSQKYDSIYIIANSIGAYFAMHTLQKCDIKKALFISPVLDMENLIVNMMKWANVTEEELRENDHLIPRKIVDEFVDSHNAGLTVMKDGEHWFHTDEQMDFLDMWMRKVI